MEGKYGRKRKRGVQLTAILLAAALLLTLMGAVLGVGKAYHLSLQVDTERISPTIAGAETRTALDLVEELNALSADEDFALGELFRPQSNMGSRMEAAGELVETAKQLLEYLGSYDEHLSTERGLVDGLSAILSGIEAARLPLMLLSMLTVFLWTLALVLLLLRRLPGSCGAAAACALLVGALPLGLLSAVGSTSQTFGRAAAAIARYGVGFEARLSLTAVGKAQVMLAVLALLCITGAIFALPRRRGRS